MDKQGQVESSCLASNNGVNQIVDANGKKVATVVVTDNGAQTLNAGQVRALNNIYGTVLGIAQATNNAMGQVARLTEQFPKFMDSMVQGLSPEGTAYRESGGTPGTFGDDAFGFVTGANNTLNRASNDFMRGYVWAASGGERHLLDDVVPISPVPPESRRGAAVGEGAMFMASLVGMPERMATKATGEFYSVAFQTQLSSKSYPGLSRGAHFQEANEALLRAMEGDTSFAKAMNGMGVNLQRTPTGLAPRESPAGWTWHHAQEPGVMQLVPREQHAPGSIFQGSLHPGGVGGYADWGKQ